MFSVTSLRNEQIMAPIEAKLFAQFSTHSPSIPERRLSPLSLPIFHEPSAGRNDDMCFYFDLEASFFFFSRAQNYRHCYDNDVTFFKGEKESTDCPMHHTECRN